MPKIEHLTIDGIVFKRHEPTYTAYDDDYQCPLETVMSMLMLNNSPYIFPHKITTAVVDGEERIVNYLVTDKGLKLFYTGLVNGRLGTVYFKSYDGEYLSIAEYERRITEKKMISSLSSSETSRSEQSAVSSDSAESGISIKDVDGCHVLQAAGESAISSDSAESGISIKDVDSCHVLQAAGESSTCEEVKLAGNSAITVDPPETDIL